MQEKITQTSSTNSEHKHSEIECFSTLNERTIAFWLQHHSSSVFRFRLKTQKTPSLSIVNKFADLR